MAVVDIAGVETGDFGEFDGVSNWALETTVVRTGSYATKNNSSSLATLTIDIAAISPCWVRFYFRKSAEVASAQLLFSFRTGSTVLASLTAESDGGLGAIATNGTTQTSSAINTDQWYRIEAKWTKSATAATIDWKIDGVAQTSSTDGDQNTDCDRCRWFHTGATGVTWYVDDIQINDAAYPGEGQIETIRPNATGDDADSDWGNTPGNNDNDPINDSQLNTRTSSGTGNLLFNATTIADVGTINHFRLGVRSSRGNGGSTTHAGRVLISGGSAENSADFGLTGSFSYRTFDPPTQPTTQADLDDIQFGAHHDGARDYTISEMWGMVDHEPAAAAASLVFKPNPMQPFLVR